MQQGKFSMPAVLSHYGFSTDSGVGHWRRVACQFHSDRTASAQYDATRFVCFACDFSGDAVDLVIWQGDATDFPGAKSFCEGIAGAGDGPVSRRPTRVSSRRVRQEAGSAAGQLDMFGTRMERKRHRA